MKTPAVMNRTIGLLFLLFFFLLFFFVPWQISIEGVPTGSSAPVSPRFFPRILGVFGCVLALFLVGKSFSPTTGSEEETIELPTSTNLLRILAIVIIIFFNLLTFDLLGYLVSTSLTLILLMGFLGLKQIKYYVLVILLFPAGIYFMFKKLLYVPFPVGILGF
jgi:hypothetical protein